jgi:hypothetical protein
MNATTKMDKNRLVDIYSKAKMLKADIVILYSNGILVGTNYGGSVIKKIQTLYISDGFIMEMTAFKSIIDNIDNYPEIVLINNNPRDMTLALIYNHLSSSTLFMNDHMIDSLGYMKIYEEYLTEDFKETYSSLRADDGSILYRNIIVHDKMYMITMFSGFIPMLKSDIVSLSIYDNPDRNDFYIQYMINRKKLSSNIYIYYHYYKTI